jgi:hypothetical protein
MPRDSAIIFGDLIGKLDLLRIECPKCGRSSRYRLADLLTRYGRNEKVFRFTEDVTANCARKQARSDNDPCSAICSDLPGSSPSVPGGLLAQVCTSATVATQMSACLIPFTDLALFPHCIGAAKPVNRGSR